MENQNQVYQAYCVKCKKKVEINNGTIKTNKKAIRYIQGNCSCGTKVNRFIKKDTKLDPVGTQ
uniref:DUF5679 domain-containing protein n=1 Tax=viral metagenome TaxID=1070528 RepID=A0A6C0EDM4_9ZZZZ